MALRLFLFLSVAIYAVVAGRVKRGHDEMPGYELFEGDMMFTKEEIQAAMNGLDPSQAGDARGLIKRGRWPNAVVPFVLHRSVKNPILNAIGLKGPKENAIYSAMKEWAQKTCIRFVPRTNQRAYVEFFNGKGCFSAIGRRGNKQSISIGSGCGTHGIVVHEIGHALGFYHEQSRPDRDNYVEILWGNIKQDKKNNFRKYGHGTIDSLGVPYDYGSIMHYGKSSFATWPWLSTIKVKKAGASIGQRSRLSVLDIKQMNLFYNCN